MDEENNEYAYCKQILNRIDDLQAENDKKRGEVWREWWDSENDKLTGNPEGWLKAYAEHKQKQAAIKDELMEKFKAKGWKFPELDGSKVYEDMEPDDPEELERLILFDLPNHPHRVEHPFTEENYEEQKARLMKLEEEAASLPGCGCSNIDHPSMDSRTLQEIFSKWAETGFKFPETETEVEKPVEMKSNSQKSKTLRKIIVFYVDVGQLPFERSTALVEHYKKEFKCVTDRLPSDCCMMYIPRRCEPTCLEILEF